MKNGFLLGSLTLLVCFMVSCAPSQTSSNYRKYLETGDPLPQDWYFVKSNEKWKLDVILPKTGEKATYILDFISDAEWVNTYIGSPYDESICCVTNRAVTGNLKAQTSSLANAEGGLFDVTVYLDPKIVIPPNTSIRNSKALICNLDGESGVGPYKGSLFVGTDLEYGTFLVPSNYKKEELGSCQFTQISN